jgi:hypothetical protein
MATYILCGKSQSVAVLSGSGRRYVINNNAWNYSDYHGQQCIETVGSGPNFKITKSLADSDSVMGYPNVSCGPSPWAESGADLMPIPLGSLPKIFGSWRTSQSAVSGSRWNTAFDIWCCSAWPGQQHRTTEIMIMLNYPGRPFGDVASINDEEFIVSVKPRRNTAGLSWVMVQYRFSRQRSSVSNLDMTSFLQYAIDRGWANARDLLVQISAGFELWVDGRGLSSDSISFEID